MPEISIILPLYNADIRCLHDCICSITSQTLTDFECILVNDGSPDKTCLETAITLTRSDPRFTLVHKENGGLASARNFGIAKATSPFITFIDQDDFLHPQRFELAILAMNTTGAEVCECRISRPEFDVSSEKTNFTMFSEKDFLQNRVIALTGQNILNTYLSYGMNITVWSHVYKTAALKARPLPEDIWGVDDLSYNLTNATLIQKLAKITIPLYYWRKNPKATTSRVPIAYTNGTADAVKYVVEFFTADTKLSSEQRLSLSKYLARTYADVLFDTIRIQRPVSELQSARKRTKEILVLIPEMHHHLLPVDRLWFMFFLSEHTQTARFFQKAAVIIKKTVSKLLRTKNRAVYWTTFFFTHRNS